MAARLNAITSGVMSGFAFASAPTGAAGVTAVVVSHDGEVWLPAVLTTLAAQSRLPEAAVGVDTGSADASPDLLATSFGAERPAVHPWDAVPAGHLIDEKPRLEVVSAIDDHINAGRLFKCANITPFTADDAAFHIVAGNIDR